MSFRIGEYVVRGELRNTKRNSVVGWIDFGGDWGVQLELTGNLEGDLAGCHIRFQTSRAEQVTEPPSRGQLDALEARQVGTTGKMLLRIVRIPAGPIEELLIRTKLDEPPPIDEKPCLYLEWYSQNGRVVAEIVDPQIEFVTKQGEPPPQVTPAPIPPRDDDESGPQIVGYARTDDGAIEEISFDDPDGEATDEYGLFPPALDDAIRDSVREGDPTPESDDDSPRQRSWDEVIPGIDEDTKRLYEQWDEIFDGEKNEPVTTLFDPPLNLPRPDELGDDAHAEPHLKALLARLAMLGIAFDMCEHCTPREAYRILIEDILPEASVHPNLTGTGFVQHYSSWESCPQCLAEFEEDDGHERNGS